MYSDTPWLGRMGLFDRPTTAIVLYLRRMSLVSGTGSRFIHLQQPAELLHFAVSQVAPLAGLESGEFEEPDLHAPELFHQDAEVPEHQANLMLSALDEFHFVPRVFIVVQ